MDEENKQEDNSPEALLKRLRSGYPKEMFIKMGELKTPVRIMPAQEQTELISNAKFDLKVPVGHDRELFEGIAVQKAVLHAASKIGAVPYLPMKLLDQLTNDELGKLYDDYLAVVKYVDPKFETLTSEQIGEMIDAVKKKQAEPTSYYTWQLAAIGRFCLEHLQLKGKGAGL